jgi:hypothetical protein
MLMTLRMESRACLAADGAPGRQRLSFQSIIHASRTALVVGCGDTAQQKQFAADRMPRKEAKNEMLRM